MGSMIKNWIKTVLNVLHLCYNYVTKLYLALKKEITAAPSNQKVPLEEGSNFKY